MAFNIQDLPDELLVGLFHCLSPTSVNGLCRTNVNLSRFFDDPEVRMSTLIKIYSNYGQEDLLILYEHLLAGNAGGAGCAGCAGGAGCAGCTGCAGCAGYVANQQESLSAVVKMRPDWLTTSVIAGNLFRPYVPATLINTRWLLTSSASASISAQDLKAVLASSAEDHVDKGLFILSNAQLEINLPGDSLIVRHRDSKMVELELCAALIEYGLDLNVYLDRWEMPLLSFIGAETTVEAWMLLSLTSGNKAVIAKNYDEGFRQAIYARGGLLSSMFNLLLALGADPNADILTYRDFELREYLKEVAGFTLPTSSPSRVAASVGMRMETIGSLRSMTELCKRGDGQEGVVLWDNNPGYHIYRSSLIPYTDKRWTELVDLYLRRRECIVLWPSSLLNSLNLNNPNNSKGLYVYGVTNPVFFLKHRGRNYSIILPYERGRGFFTAVGLWLEGIELDLLLSGTYIANVGSKTIRSLYGFKHWKGDFKDDVLRAGGATVREIQTKKYRLEFVVPETEETYTLQCQSDEYRQGIAVLLAVFGHVYHSKLEC